jgi:hypothetical protein
MTHKNSSEPLLEQNLTANGENSCKIGVQLQFRLSKAYSLEHTMDVSTPGFEMLYMILILSSLASCRNCSRLLPHRVSG